MRFVSRPQVRLDLIEATGFYQRVSNDLKLQFLFRVGEARSLIAKNPQFFPVRYAGKIRTILLKQFPYHIHFSFDDNDTIVIYAIIYVGRKPADYSNR